MRGDSEEARGEPALDQAPLAEDPPKGDRRERPSPARVLIVVPTLGRRPAFLRQTLMSIVGQDTPVDVLIVAPTGAPGVRVIADEFGARVLDDPGSMSGAINLGIAHASPAIRYANWLGDDDVLGVGSIGAVSQALDTHPDCVAAFGHCTYLDPDGNPLWVSKAGRLAPWVMTWGPNLVPQPGMLFRIDAWRRVGGLDERLQYAMDLDLLMRLRREGSFISLRRPVAGFRWHPESITVAQRSRSLAEADMIRLRYASRPARWAVRAVRQPVHLATRLAASRVTSRAAKSGRWR